MVNVTSPVPPATSSTQLSGPIGAICAMVRSHSLYAPKLLTALKRS